MVGFIFQDSGITALNGSVNLDTIKTVVYEDSTGKYTFGVDGNNNNAFKTFKYEPSSGAGAGTAVDYSALAEEFMKGGVAGTLLGKLTTIDTNVGLVKDKTDKLDPTATTAGTLGKALSELAKAQKLLELDGKVGEVKAKTEKLDLTNANAPGTLAEALDKLAKTTDLTPLTTAAGKITAIETVVGNSPLAPMLTGLESKVDAIKTQTNPIPTNLTARLNALDLTNANAPGTLAEALDKLAKTTDLTPLTTAVGKITAIETVVGNSPLAPMLTGLESKVDAIKTQTNPIPTNLTARLNALDPTSTDAGSLGKALSELAKAQKLLELDGKVGEVKVKTDKLDPTDTTTGSLGKALKGIQDKTDNLDPEDTAEGTLGKALETISAEATANLNALKALLEALNPDASSKSLLSATLKEIKDKTDKLDLKNTDTDSGTLGEALEAIRLEAGTVSLDLKTLTACVDALKPEAPEQESPQSNSGYTQNEDIWGIQ